MAIRPQQVLAGLVLAVAASGAGAAQEPADKAPAPLTLAMLRRDSVLIPFATWTGKAWTTTWPVPQKAAQTPITLDALPRRWWGKSVPVTDWYAWTRDGRTHTLRSITPTWYLAHCQQGTGIRSTYTPPEPPPPPIVQPYPKDGVAASAAIKFHPIGVLSEASPVWKAVLDALQPRLAEAEERVVSAYAKTGWKHPYQEGREQVPIVLEALYRVPVGTGGQFAYYFEAVKRYAPKPDARAAKPPGGRDAACEVVTFVSGWFRAGNTDPVVTLDQLRPVVTSCDYANADVMLPLAYLMWNGRPLWIAQFSGWGREWFTMLDLGTAGVATIVFETSGGSCPIVGG